VTRALVIGNFWRQRSSHHPVNSFASVINQDDRPRDVGSNQRTTMNIEITEHSPASLFDLPPPSTKRWVVRRKAVVVAAVRNGMLSLQEACERYNLSVEEFLAWQRSLDRYGVPGLRVTRLQIYRDTDTLLAKRQSEAPRPQSLRAVRR
jgi:hypothetical protein